MQSEVEVSMDGMKSWQKAEIYFAEKLRNSTYEERKKLYRIAYESVSREKEKSMQNLPRQRTEGTNEGTIKSLIQLCEAGDRVLEVGCGRGYTCYRISSHVGEVHGIDVSDHMLTEARILMNKHKVGNYEFSNLSGCELTNKFENGHFDFVFSIDTYEHFHPEDAKIHLSEVHAVLKPNGTYAIFTPNRITGPHDVTKSLFPNRKSSLGFHLNEITFKEVIMNLFEAGFSKFKSIMCSSDGRLGPIMYPTQLSVILEDIYQRFKLPFLENLMSVKIIAEK